MHDDTSRPERGEDWGPYLARLREAGVFEGGSAIGEGRALRRGAPAGSLTRQLTGFLRIRAPNLEAAEGYVVGNPVYEAGGTVEVRLLPPD